VLEVQVWGGVLANCGVLEHEATINVAQIAAVRLWFLQKILRRTSEDVKPKANKGEPNQNQADLQAALTYLNQSAKFREIYAEFQRLGLKIVVNRKKAHSFDWLEQPNQVTWDPDGGLIMEEGISSPAAGLAHEIAHAVRYHQIGRYAYAIEDHWAIVQVPDPNDPTRTVPQYKVPTSENDATSVEAQIESQLNEPVRKKYLDGVPTSVLVSGPTFSRRRGNAACDTLIQNHPKDP
jgi:hypothetical protein